jgi:CDP-diacylglycerol--glycerol-3-phosphate 3-phosphatidyltransferase
MSRVEGAVAQPAGPTRRRSWGGRAWLLAVGTGARIVVAPIVMGLVLGGDYTVAAILFALAATTDWFDGRLARRWAVASPLGSFLDTTADKLLVTAGLVGLVAVHRASPWLALVIIGRELVLLGLRAAVAAQGRHLEPSPLGKWKATVQFVAIALVMLRPDVKIAGAWLDEWVLILATVVTVWSAADYLSRFRDALPGS